MQDTIPAEQTEPLSPHLDALLIIFNCTFHRDERSVRSDLISRNLVKIKRALQQ